jgi:hypothetical protein
MKKLIASNRPGLRILFHPARRAPPHLPAGGPRAEARPPPGVALPVVRRDPTAVGRHRRPVHCRRAELPARAASAGARPPPEGQAPRTGRGCRMLEPALIRRGRAELPAQVVATARQHRCLSAAGGLGSPRGAAAAAHWSRRSSSTGGPVTCQNSREEIRMGRKKEDRRGERGGN